MVQNGGSEVRLTVCPGKGPSLEAPLLPLRNGQEHWYLPDVAVGGSSFKGV